MVDTLHLSDEQYQSVIAGLDHSHDEWEGGERRQSARIPCRRDAIFVWEFSQFRNPPQRYLVQCRNISTGGAAFLHSFYVHPSTKCSLILLRQEKGGIRLGGTVVRCQHLTGIIHDVGMKFDQLLDENLMPIVTADDESAEHTTADSADAPPHHH